MRAIAWSVRILCIPVFPTVREAPLQSGSLKGNTCVVLLVLKVWTACPHLKDSMTSKNLIAA